MNLIISERSRRDTRRPLLRVIDRGKRSESPVTYGEVARPHRPELRLVAEGAREPVPRAAPVLLVGADARSRAMLRAEFGTTLTPRTPWVEAEDVAGMLEHAAHSRMVILAGDLDDVDTESLMSMLSHRHPELPVICVDASLPAVAGVRG